MTSHHNSFELGSVSAEQSLSSADVFRIERPSPHCTLAVGEHVRVNIRYPNGWWYCTSQSGQQSNIHWSCLAPVRPTPMQTTAAGAPQTPFGTATHNERPLIVLDIILYFAAHMVFSFCMLGVALAATVGDGLVVWAQLHQVPFVIGIFAYYCWKQQDKVRYQDEPPGPALVRADEREWYIRCAAWCGKCHLVSLVAMLYVAYYGAAIGLHFRAFAPLYDEENLKVWWFMVAMSVVFQQFTIVTDKSITIVQLCVCFNTYSVSLRKHTLSHRWGFVSTGEAITTVSAMENDATNGMMRTGVNYWSLLFKLALAIASIVVFALDI